jgi:hypothetical protein
VIASSRARSRDYAAAQPVPALSKTISVRRCNVLAAAIDRVNRGDGGLGLHLAAYVTLGISRRRVLDPSIHQSNGFTYGNCQKWTGSQLTRVCCLTKQYHVLAAVGALASRNRRSSRALRIAGPKPGGPYRTAMRSLSDGPAVWFGSKTTSSSFHPSPSHRSTAMSAHFALPNGESKFISTVTWMV